MNQFVELLRENNIDEVKYGDVLVDTVLLNIFADTCKRFKEDKVAKIKFLNLFRAHTKKKVSFIQNYVLESYMLKISADQAAKLATWLKCFYTKKTTRTAYSVDVKRHYLTLQNNRCNYCSKETTFENAELDHIIPFAYVGDELNDNLQILCQKCNLEKSSNITSAMFNTLKFKDSNYLSI